MKKSKKKSLPEGVIRKVEVVLQPAEAAKKKKASAPVKKKADSIPDPAPKRLKEELSEAMPHIAARAPDIVKPDDDMPDVFHVRRDFEPIGIGLGENTFKVDDTDTLVFDLPRLREDGRYSEKDLNLYKDDKYVEDKDAPFSTRWVEQHELRIKILEQDPNYAFLVLVAGYANTDVFKLYTNEDLNYLVRRDQSLRLSEQLAIKEATVTKEKLTNTIRDLENTLKPLSLEVIDMQKKLDNAINVFQYLEIANSAYIKLRIANDIYDYSRKKAYMPEVMNNKPYYNTKKIDDPDNPGAKVIANKYAADFIYRESGITLDDRYTYTRYASETLMATEVTTFLKQIIVDDNEDSRTYISLYRALAYFIDFLRRHKILKDGSPGDLLYEADISGLSLIPPDMDNKDRYTDVWEMLMKKGWRDTDKTGIMNYYAPQFEEYRQKNKIKDEDNTLDYTAKLVREKWEEEFWIKKKLKDETEKSLAIARESLNKLNRNEPIPATIPVPHYEHRREYAQSPAVSGIVHIEPRVSSAMSAAYMYLVREVTWIRDLHEAGEITPEFFQRDATVRDSFAELVAVQMAAAMDDFPRRWRSDKEKGKIMKRKRDVGMRFVNMYEARTELVGDKWKLVGKLRPRSASFSPFGK